MPGPENRTHGAAKKRLRRMPSRPLSPDVPVQVEMVDNPIDYLRWKPGLGETAEVRFGDIHPPLQPTPELIAASREASRQAGRQLSGVRCCLAPGCQKTGQDIIEAHSISKASILKLLAVDGHVWAPHGEMTVGQAGEYLMASPFKSVGVNQATTFTGLCGEHDNALFDLIDNNEVDLASKEYLFRLAYRAILRDTYEQVCILDCLKQVDSVPVTATGDPIDPFTFMYQTSCQSVEYKEGIDEMLTAGSWAGLRHKIFRLPRAKPYVAASALMALDDQDRATTRKSAFSVVPFKEGTLAVFSSTESDYPYLKAYLDRQIKAPPKSKRFLHELTITILRDTYNFVISPKLWSKLSNERQKQAADYYLASRLTFPSQQTPHKSLCFFQ